MCILAFWLFFSLFFSVLFCSVLLRARGDDGMHDFMNQRRLLFVVCFLLDFVFPFSSLRCVCLHRFALF